MIISGLITREVGERLLREQPYASEKDMRLDYDYVLKKLGFSKVEFENYLASNEVPHNTYKSERALWDFLNSLRKKITVSGK